VLPIVVLLSAILALGLASGVVYALASNDVITLNGQSQGILFILVVGAATDYALLLVSRFREELREYESKVDAFKVAYRGVLEPIVASGTTVILGLLCLLLSSLSSNQGLGPVGALGIAGAMLAALTFLPAVLLLLGRWAFWPFRPAYGSEHPEQRGIWGRVSRLVGRFPRRVWVLTVLALAVAAAFVPQFKDEGVPQNDTFLTTVESVEGQEAFAGKFPVGTADPTFVALQPDQVPAVLDVASGVEGVAPPQPAGDQGAGQPPVAEDGRTLLPLILQDAVDSPEAEATVERLRAAFDEAGLEDVEVGGNTAIALDVRDASTADRNLIIPVILLVIFVVLALLLRALLIPLLLVLANVLSFGATLGVSALVFNYIFDFPGGDPAVTLIAFVFLVALGIDYSIFLMTRVREESLELGTRPGILLGLSQTGGVITSAGVVLAATFSALGILPILFLAQIAFLVAFGVLLDTIVVRSLLVPALSHDIGSAIWWPSRLWRAEAQPGRRAPTHRAG
jgi:RND superfamily putative drug exporter